MMTEKVDENALDSFFQSRIRALETLSLQDILKCQTPFLLRACATDTGSATDIVADLMEDYLASHCPTPPLNITQQKGIFSSSSKSQYETWLANTENKLIREFLTEFLLPSGLVDWAKLVQFTSTL